MKLIKKYEFCSAHFYNNTKWPDSKNLDEFGKCFSKYGHGHNYQLVISLTTTLPNLKILSNDLDQIVSEILKSLDHKHLNFTNWHFKKTIPTTENITVYIKNKIQKSLKRDDFEVILFELNSLYAKFPLKSESHARGNKTI